MADPAQELPDLPPRLDQAILDPLLTRDQLQALCDSGMQEGVRAICTTPRQPVSYTHLTLPTKA